MKILGLCGSLRKSSSNAYLLKAAKLELSTHSWSEFDLSTLPYFDPDNQYSDKIPETVRHVRALATDCDVIFISTPEYAHGMPGILKNALEWIFHEGTQKMRAYVVIGSAEGENTQSHIVEVMSTMDFQIDRTQTLLLKSLRTKVDSEGRFQDATAKAEFSRFCLQITAPS